MKLIVITQPEFFEDEAAAITSLFDAGLEILHLRKPGASYEDMDKALAPPSGGIHGAHRYPRPFRACIRTALERYSSEQTQPGSTCWLFTGHVSRSCHSLEEVAEYKAACNYVFLSPIYNSISKEGYAAAYAFDDLRKAHQAGIIDSGGMALGGVTAEHLPEINSLGFGGVGLLGDIWQRTGTDFINHFRELLRSASVF